MTIELDAYYGLIDSVGVEYGGQTCRIPRSYPDGNYTLRMITLENGYSEWREPDVVGGIALNQIPIVLNSTQIRFNASSTAIHDVEISDFNHEDSEVEYYSVDGTRISKPVSGQMYLEKRKNRDGLSIVSKKIGKN